MRKGRTSRDSRASGRSSLTPSPPHIWMALSTIRPIASAAYVLAMDVDAEARSPLSSSQQARSSSARVAAISISLSATSCWIIPRSASREPKAWRSATCRRAIS